MTSTAPTITVVPGAVASLAFTGTAGAGQPNTSRTAAIAAGIEADTSSSTYSITAGTASQLSFLQPPVDTANGITISPAITVGITDVYGNVVTNAAAKNVTLSILTNPGASTLSGTLTRATVSGIATFNDISLNNGANDYVLTATCTTSGCTYTAANSAAFDILSTSPVNLEHAIELTDVSLTSTTAAVNHKSTYFNFDPAWFGGFHPGTAEPVFHLEKRRRETPHARRNQRVLLRGGRLRLRRE